MVNAKETSLVFNLWRAELDGDEGSKEALTALLERQPLLFEEVSDEYN